MLLLTLSCRSVFVLHFKLRYGNEVLSCNAKCDRLDWTSWYFMRVFVLCVGGRCIHAYVCFVCVCVCVCVCVYISVSELKIDDGFRPYQLSNNYNFITCIYTVLLRLPFPLVSSFYQSHPHPLSSYSSPMQPSRLLPGIQVLLGKLLGVFLRHDPGTRKHVEYIGLTHSCNQRLQLCY